MEKESNISIQVIGKVQGVWFRASTKKMADELGVCGTVKNLSDGSVYIEARGNFDTLEKFKKWCSKGPEFAEVNKLIVSKIEYINYNTFTIDR